MRKIVPVILCGGSGTRLWPISRKETPKQFLRLMDSDTLLQKTAKRTLGILGIDGSSVVTISLRSLYEETKRQLEEVTPALTRHLLLEPQARNTAAAAAFATHYAQDMFGDDALLWILPSDHYIGDEGELAEALEKAAEAAENGYMVTFGIQPTRPETGYGYIRKSKRLNGSGVCHVRSFIEKPAYRHAVRLIKDRNCLWNSGMHLFNVRTGRHNFCRLSPQTWIVVRNAMMESARPDRPASITYGVVKEEPFEKAILEKADNVAVVPCDPKWSDIGCWESLWEIKEKDQFGNACNGNVLCHDTRNSMILAEDRLITCVGLKDIIVIETGDSLLIADKKSNESLKVLVQQLQQANRKETEKPDRVRYDWGHRHMVVSYPGVTLFENLIRTGKTYTQIMTGRSSQWIVASGQAKVDIEGVVREYSENQTFQTPKDKTFSIANPASDSLKVYELQYSSQNRAPAAPTSQRPSVTPPRSSKSVASQKAHIA